MDAEQTLTSASLNLIETNCNLGLARVELEKIQATDINIMYPTEKDSKIGVRTCRDNVKVEQRSECQNSYFEDRVSGKKQYKASVYAGALY